MITIIIDGDEHDERIKKDFEGDELTSPESEAILFLESLIKEKAEF